MPKGRFKLCKFAGREGRLPPQRGCPAGVEAALPKLQITVRLFGFLHSFFQRDGRGTSFDSVSRFGTFRKQRGKPGCRWSLPRLNHDRRGPMMSVPHRGSEWVMDLIQADEHEYNGPTRLPR